VNAANLEVIPCGWNPSSANLRQQCREGLVYSAVGMAAQQLRAHPLSAQGLIGAQGRHRNHYFLRGKFWYLQLAQFHPLLGGVVRWKVGEQLSIVGVEGLWVGCYWSRGRAE